MTRDPLVVVGAGGFGREAAEAARASGWDVLGFADDDARLWGTEVLGVPVLGGVREVVADNVDARLVLSPGSPSDWSVKRRLEQVLDVPCDRYATVVHPAASVGSSVTLAPGVVVLAGAVLTAGVDVGRHVGLMPTVVLTHDVRVRDFATLAAGVLVAGGAVLEEESYLGAGAIVGPGVVIGAGSLVGAGANVRHDVPAGQVWVGNPARFLREVRG